MKIVAGILMSFGVAASVLVAPAAFATTQQCVDGSERTNLHAVLGDRGTVTVETVNNAPLCETVTLNLSSFNLPSNYNGEGFKNNDTAIPQTQFANTVITLTKGMTSSVTAKVPTPRACKPTQVDLYYGPNQTEIRTSEGLVGTDAIIGKIYNGTGECVTSSSVQKTAPVEQAQPAAQSATVVQPAPTELAATGVTPLESAGIATMLAGGAYVTSRLIRAAFTR